MKKRVKTLTISTVILIGLLSVLPAMATTTLIGEVGDAYEIITDDGTVYYIEDSEKGTELADMVGEKVSVTGTIKEADGEKTIMVDSFMVIEK